MGSGGSKPAASSACVFGSKRPGEGPDQGHNRKPGGPDCTATCAQHCFLEPTQQAQISSATLTHSIVHSSLPTCLPGLHATAPPSIPPSHTCRSRHWLDVMVAGGDPVTGPPICCAAAPPASAPSKGRKRRRRLTVPAAPFGPLRVWRWGGAGEVRGFGAALSPVYRRDCYAPLLQAFLRTGVCRGLQRVSQNPNPPTSPTHPPTHPTHPPQRQLQVMLLAIHQVLQHRGAVRGAGRGAPKQSADEWRPAQSRAAGAAPR